LIERVPSGIDGLDPLIEGGFPRGSLILLAGNTGTGKTVFGSRFICRGATRHGENGICVSFLEGKETYIANISRFCDQDHVKLDEEGRFRILDFVTMKEEGVSATLESILGEIHELKAKRLVIDSFSAMAQAFKEPIDARIVLHTILSKMVRQAGCTTLLIVETPMGREGLGLGMEEFVADGVIILRRGEVEGRSVRELEIAKLRGTEIKQPKHIFTMGRGFRVCAPFSLKLPKERKRFEPIRDTETHFSTGSEQLDKILGGGYPGGSFWVIEADQTVPFISFRLFAAVTVLNFIHQKRGTLYYPPPGVTYEEVKNLYSGFVDPKALKLTRVCEVNPRRKEPSVVAIGGSTKDLEKDEKAWNEAKEDLRRKTKQSVLMLLSLVALESRYGESREKIFNVVTNQIASCRANGDLTIALSRPQLASGFRAASLAGNVLRLTEKNGTILFYGVNPRTELYAVEADFSKGYPQLEFTPIT